MPAFSLLVPCINEADGLPRFVERTWTALDGCSPFGAVEWEIILIDDGSRDASWERIAELRGRFPGLRAIRHERTAGIPGAWRSGLSLALRRIAVGIGIVIPTLVGLSRIGLGVHFPSDVVGGWLLGVAFVSLGAVLIRSTGAMTRDLPRRTSAAPSPRMPT